MRVGDILEWLGAAAFTAAAYLATHLAWPALIVAGVVLAYEAQCYAGHPVKLPRVRIPRLRLPRRKAAE